MATASEMLEKYLAAEQAILEGKEARIGDRTLRLEDLAAVREGRKEWEARVAAESQSTSCKPKRNIGGRGFSLARLDK